MHFDKAHDVQQILLPLAGAAFRVLICEEPAFESIFQRRHAQQDAMHIGGDGAGGKISIKIFRAQLQTDANVR